MAKILLTLLLLAFMAVGESRHTARNLNARAKAKQLEETERGEVCMKELGCFQSGIWGNWIKSEQYFNTLPDNREDIGTEFRFYAPGKGVQTINGQKFVVPTGFDASLNIKFIIHGYNGGNSQWAVDMKDAFQKREECNVFLVDWSKGAEGIYLGPAVNIQVVGAETGLFIEKLVRKAGIDVLKVHLLGHSLGAHTAGYAGKWVVDKLHRKVGRITGMDPAGPEFHKADSNKRLDIGDAELVDVIHTNFADYAGSGLGLPQPVGHFDFYPNGGEDQPGCSSAFYATFESASQYISNVFVSKKTDPNAVDPIACSHSRAYELVIASLREDSCGFYARMCSSWVDYTNGQCDENKSVQMGYNADKYKNLIHNKKHIELYLTTSAGPPYCVDQKE